VFGQGKIRCNCKIVNWKYQSVEVGGYNLIYKCGFCGQGILKCICIIVNWKNVTVGFARLSFDIVILCEVSVDTEK
jgi:hypothetical protein